MLLKKVQFFDYQSCTANPLSPGISLDRGRNDIFFQLEIYLPKVSIRFQKYTPGNLLVPLYLSNKVYDDLPELLNYNMELFGLGNTKQDNFTEYLLFFKPWYLGEDDETHLDYLENFIYAVPYRILKSLLAHGIRLKNFSLSDLKKTRVIKDFDDSFFEDLLKNWEDMSKMPVPYMGSGIGEKIYEQTNFFYWIIYTIFPKTGNIYLN